MKINCLQIFIIMNYDITNSKPKFEINNIVRLYQFIDVYKNKLYTNLTYEIFIFTIIQGKNIL